MESLKRILRDQMWQFIGAGLTLVFGFWAIYTYVIDRDTYAIQMVILANTSLIEVKQDVVNDIDVYYKGQQADNLSLIQIKIENTGTEAIRKEDYEGQPIRLIFPPETQLLEATILESFPPNIGWDVKVENNVAELPPVLLNSQDRAIVRFLAIDMPISDNPVPFEVDARIVNISQIDLVNAIDDVRPLITSYIFQLVPFALQGAMLIVPLICVMAPWILLLAVFLFRRFSKNQIAS